MDEPNSHETRLINGLWVRRTPSVSVSRVAGIKPRSASPASVLLLSGGAHYGLATSHLSPHTVCQSLLVAPLGCVESDPLKATVASGNRAVLVISALHIKLVSGSSGAQPCGKSFGVTGSQLQSPYASGN